ncbi:NAD(P)-dependent oxidoreductase [Niallia sp. 03091]|uniref:NAD(P)-dependent oxidoreductase n=1 Tax=unclassified Niallia TaxID=2837522 RepID=UPI004043FE42
MKIGWIGLGNMGIPIASNLIKAGFNVKIYNRTAAKGEELVKQGAVQAENLQELVETSDVIFTMVSDDAAVKSLYFDQNLFGLADAGKIFIDMSTVSPKTSKELYNVAKKSAVSFLDAPVSGSVQPAKDGTLIVLVGGEEATYQQVKPLFEPMSKMSLYLGDSGSGSNAKLAINLLLGITVQGIAESVLFAQNQGINTEDMLTIISESAVGTAISKMKTPSILHNDFPAAFALKHMAKDLRLASETDELLPIGTSANETYQQALANNLGDEDVMAVIEQLRKK